MVTKLYIANYSREDTFPQQGCRVNPKHILMPANLDVVETVNMRNETEISQGH